MDDCIFCNIIKGEIDCATVFEDQDVLVLLDVKPATKGHCLVIPKQHFENIFDINKEALQKIITTAKYISEKIKKNLGADGINIMQASGRCAGQEVMHFHLHIMPRYEGDGLKIHGQHSANKASDLQELKKLAAQIV